MNLASLHDNQLWTPDGRAAAEALADVTHLGIGAHADDLEIMAWPGIAEARATPGHAFAGITCTDGGDSPRSGPFAGTPREAMVRIRRAEQIEAARRGGYACMIQPGLLSREVRGPGRGGLADLVAEVTQAGAVRTVYTHSPLDAHPTHRAVCAAVLAGLRRLPADRRPERVLGCEVWRGLDWLPPNRVIRLDASADPGLARDLIAQFRSQTEGGKRYVEAALGRWHERATFGDPHAVDDFAAVALAVDLSPAARGEITLQALAADLLESAAAAIRRDLADLA